MGACRLVSPSSAVFWGSTSGSRLRSVPRETTTTDFGGARPLLRWPPLPTPRRARSPPLVRRSRGSCSSVCVPAVDCSAICRLILLLIFHPPLPPRVCFSEFCDGGIDGLVNV